MSAIETLIQNCAKAFIENHSTAELIKALKTGDLGMIDWVCTISCELDKLQLSKLLKEALVPTNSNPINLVPDEHKAELVQLCDFVLNDGNFLDLMEDCIHQILQTGEIENNFWSYVAIDVLDDKYDFDTQLTNRLELQLAGNHLTLVER